MSLKSTLKKSKVLVFLWQKWLNGYYATLSLLNPKWNVSRRYKQAFKKKIDFDNPQTLEEKLQWLKIYDYNSNPLVIQCADKYAVREYVKKCGYGHILNELYAVYDDPKQIDWESLPDQFVLKWNFGCGLNVVCKDKSALDEKQTKKKLKKWKGNKKYLLNAELQYKYAPKKLVCEEFLSDSEQKHGLIDYKVYCFHGEPKAILVMADREIDVKAEFFTTEWERLVDSKKYEPPKKQTSKPACLEQMIEAARKLTEPFPFVRCDFYVVQGKLYLGEMTFTPAGGLYLSKTEIDGKDMTEFLKIK